MSSTWSSIGLLLEPGCFGSGVARNDCSNHNITLFGRICNKHVSEGADPCPRKDLINLSPVQNSISRVKHMTVLHSDMIAKLPGMAI